MQAAPRKSQRVTLLLRRPAGGRVENTGQVQAHHPSQPRPTHRRMAAGETATKTLKRETSTPTKADNKPVDPAPDTDERPRRRDTEASVRAAEEV